MGYQEQLDAKLQLIADSYDVTLEQVCDLRRAMEATWGQIASDWYDCFEGGWEEADETYKDEAEMIAENTLDADRVVTFNSDLDLEWVYVNDDGSHRLNVIEMGEEILRANTSRW